MGCQDHARLQKLLGVKAIDVWQGFLHVSLCYVTNISLSGPLFSKLLQDKLNEFQQQQLQPLEVTLSPGRASFRRDKFAVVPVQFSDHRAKDRVASLLDQLSGIQGMQISSSLDFLHITVSKYGKENDSRAVVKGIKHLYHYQQDRRPVPCLSLGYVEVWSQREIGGNTQYDKARTRRPGRHSHTYQIDVPKCLAAVTLQGTPPSDGDRFS